MKRAWRILKTAFLPALAVMAFGIAAWHVFGSQKSGPPPRPPIQPASSPFGASVAASGIAEPRTENIAIGTNVAGIITEVNVAVGQHVRAGDLLFKIDDRQVKADLEVRQAMRSQAEVQLRRLEQMPRPEELPASLAKVHEAEANLKAARDHLDRGKKLVSRGAITQEDLVEREQAFETAREQVARAESEDALLRAGSWRPDLEVARVAVELARVQVEQTRTEWERMSMRAPVDGEVLQVNVRPGEFVATPASQGLMILGDIRTLHVRVDIDEHDIPRFRPGAPAKASVRGDQGQRYALSFVRVEPYVIPKKSLTGDNTERVDTRVLQVIYALHPGDRPVYVGQQLDVFIDAAPRSAGGESAAPPDVRRPSDAAQTSSRNPMTAEAP